MLAVGAVVIIGQFFSRLLFLSSYSLSLEDGPIVTKMLSKRAVKPKTTNQLINHNIVKAPHPGNFIAGRTKAALLVWFFRAGVVGWCDGLG